VPARQWTTREFKDSILAELYDDFAPAVRAGQTPPCTGEDGREALEIVAAIYRSAHTGQPVSLPL
jgi:predicted dehydrogenase